MAVVLRDLQATARALYARLLEPWTLEACCRGRTDLFFRDDVSEKNGQLVETEKILQAKTICARCPVRRQCLEYAFESEDGEFRSGIYGGMTGQEREQQAHNPHRLEALGAMFERQVWEHRLGERRDYVA